MHPNPYYRCDDREALESFIGGTGIGTVFLTTPDGPAAARTPLVLAGDRRIQFHLARHNALVGHLNGATILISVDGPAGYISPRWYSNRDTVPTWNYISVEVIGTVSRLSDDDLDQFLHSLIKKQEEALGGDRWHASETSEAVWRRLFKGIVGYEIKVGEYRPTFKLSQDKPEAERERISNGLARKGRHDLVRAMWEMPV